MSNKERIFRFSYLSQSEYERLLDIGWLLKGKREEGLSATDVVRWLSHHMIAVQGDNSIAQVAIYNDQNEAHP